MMRPSCTHRQLCALHICRAVKTQAKGKKKQLSWMSRGKVLRRSAGSTLFEDGVEDDQHLAHTSHQSYLPGLAGTKEPLVELLDLCGLWRVASSAPMYNNADLTVALPPHTARLPRKTPQSLLSRATPTKAANCLDGRLPSAPEARPRASLPVRAQPPARRAKALR